MSETRPRSPDPRDESPRRTHRPLERFWPYVEPSEDPTPEELAALDPDLHDALFGPAERRFSITLSFPRFESDTYQRAVALARQAPEYREVGAGDTLRHRARFYPDDAVALRDLFQLVGDQEGCQVLIDDRPVPFAKELWLPLVWMLIR